LRNIKSACSALAFKQQLPAHFGPRIQNAYPLDPDPLWDDRNLAGCQYIFLSILDNNMVLKTTLQTAKSDKSETYPLDHYNGWHSEGCHASVYLHDFHGHHSLKFAHLYTGTVSITAHSSIVSRIAMPTPANNVLTSVILWTTLGLASSLAANVVSVLLLHEIVSYRTDLCFTSSDCGNGLTPDYGSSTDCDMRCTGDESQICGGINATNVYQYSEVLSSYEGYTVQGCVA